jgi:hypothetical protein
MLYGVRRANSAILVRTTHEAAATMLRGRSPTFHKRLASRRSARRPREQSGRFSSVSRPFRVRKISRLARRLVGRQSRIGQIEQDRRALLRRQIEPLEVGQAKPFERGAGIRPSGPSLTRRERRNAYDCDVRVVGEKSKPAFDAFRS